MWNGGAYNWPVILPESKLQKKENVQSKIHQTRPKTVKLDKPVFSRADKVKCKVGEDASPPSFSSEGG